MTFRLADRCPRLARARDGWREHDLRQRAAERRRTTDLLKAERLLAHRELQLLRAYRTGSRSYIAQRARKLADTQRAVDRLRVTPTKEKA